MPGPIASLNRVTLAVTGTALTVIVAPIAHADPIFPTAGNESASATISDLQSEGFNVTVNYLQGHPNVPLSECRVNGINNPSSPAAAPEMVTVYVDVLCPNAK
jgi:hypothetical protein